MDGCAAPRDARLVRVGKGMVSNADRERGRYLSGERAQGELPQSGFSA